MYLTELIVRKYSWLVTFTKFLIREYNTITPMPLLSRLNMWRLGFFSAAWYRYEFFKRGKTSEYVSDYQENLKASRINTGSMAWYLDDKIVFPLFFRSFAPVVENLALISQGMLVPQKTVNTIKNWSELINYIEHIGGIIAKPMDGQRGGKVHTFKFSPSEGLLHNDRQIDRDELISLVKTLNHNIICPLVRQSRYSENFYPRTTNTVRILTMIDPETNEAFIAHAVQRVGTKHSFPVDNFAVGGITFNIDLSTGIIGEGSYIIPTESRKVWYTHHPETNVQIKGTQIPNWKAITKKILQVAQPVSFLKIVGWDLIIKDDENMFVLLEGNNAPCFKVHQLHGGFLKDDRVKKFMKFHKII